MRIQINTKKSYLASKFTCFVGLLFWLSTAADAQSFTFDWVKCENNIQSDNWVNPHIVSSDIYGDVLGTGEFVRNAKIGDSLFLNKGSSDIFIVKYDKSGNVIWANTIGGKMSETSNSLSIDPIGNIYLTGHFTSDTLFFGSKFLLREGFMDCYLIKLDVAGNFIWGKSFGGRNGNVIGKSVFVQQDFLYLTGDFNKVDKFVLGSDTLFNKGGNDLFVMKCDLNGNVLWAKSEGSDAEEVIQDLYVDKNGIYLAGRFSSTRIDFGSDSHTNSGSGSFDIFLLKYDLNGNIQWSTTAGGTKADWINSVTVDKSGNIYITGDFQDSAKFDQYLLTSVGSIDIFLAKYDSDGKLVWVRSNGSKGTDRSYDVVVDTFQLHVYITGTFPSNDSIQLGTTVLKRRFQGSSVSFSGNAYVIKYDNMGNVIWGETIFVGSGGIIESISSSKLLVTADNDIYCAGISSASEIYFSDLLIKDKKGVFLAKLKMECDIVIFDTVSVTSCNRYASPSGKHIWTTSGSYLDTITNYNGCDSILTINLIIDKDTSGVTKAETTSCNRYISPSGNHTWTSSGIYKDTLMNAMGCDSIVEIHLTLLRNTQDTINITSCESYTSPSGKYTWNSSTSYLKDTIPNSVGCDSILTINLIITNNSESTLSIEVCNDYLSPSGRFTWKASGTYTDTIPNSAGCDSFMSIRLNVKEVDVSVSLENKTLRALAEWLDYQWLDCNNDYAPIPGANNRSYTPVANGSYAVEITDGDCVDTSLCYEVEVTSINDQLSSKNRIQLYPNPSSGYIMLNMDIQGGKQIQVFDVLSKKLFDVRTNKKHYQFDLQGISDGIYLMRIGTDHGVIEKKLVLRR